MSSNPVPSPRKSGTGNIGCLSQDSLLSWMSHPGITVARSGPGKHFTQLEWNPAMSAPDRVFAVEWRPGVIDELRARLTCPDIPDNVDLLWASSDTHFATASCNLVIFADIWHETRKP